MIETFIMLFVHATTSAILPLLRVTGYQLVNVQELLFTHGVAPMSGEIFCGGVAGICDKVTTAFAEIDSSYWDFQSLVGNYAGRKWEPKIKNSEELYATIQKELELFPPDHGFFRRSKAFLDSGIVTALINCLRHLQMSSLPQMEEDKITILEIAINKRLTATILELQMNYVVARFFIRIAETESYESWEEVCELFCEISKKLPLDLLKRSESDQYHLLKPLIESDENTSSTFKKYFILQETIPGKDKIKLKRDLKHSINHPKENRYLSSVVEYYNIDHGKLQSEIRDAKNLEVDVDYARKIIQESIDKLSRCCNLLLQTVRQACRYKISPAESHYIEAPFPLIFVSDNESDLERLKREYRAKRALKLGIDINLVATDDAHVELLRQYMSEHDSLTTVRVVSIAEIETCRNNSMCATIDSISVTHR